MDAAPPVEDVQPFCEVDRRLRLAGLHAPAIIQADTTHGFLLLEDLGDDLYRGLLDENTVNQNFVTLFEVLRDMALNVEHSGLPIYDANLLKTELDLFPNWYLGHHRLQMSRVRFNAVWAPVCERLISSALSQPQCFVHRDFHSCNLLKTPAGQVGIIDFQDAVSGPISYDFISLIWDRYISWPRRQLLLWIESFRQLLGLDMPADDWLRCCDLMGLQRHIKVVGIFARLYYRDGKNGYIEMIPRFYDYLLSTLRHYPEFAEFMNVLEQDSCMP